MLNSFTRGRFFDPATLPSFTGSTFSCGITYLKSRSSNSLRTSTSSSKDADGTEHESYDNWLRREKTISQPVDHLNGLNSINNIPSADSRSDSSTDGNAATGEAAGQNGGKGLPFIEPEPPLVDAKGASKGSLVGKPRIVGNSLLAGPQETKESNRFSELARPKAIISPSEIPPLAANDSGFMPVSAIADLPSQEISSSSQKVPSTLKGDQDSGSNRDDFLGQDSGKASDVEGLQIKIPDGLNEHLAKTTISAITRSYPASRENTLDEGQTNRRLDSETSGYIKPLARDLAECDSHGIKNVTSVLRSQQGNTTLDSACNGPPSTPDEQLRLEEAQSLQQPKIPSDAINEQGQDKAESYQTETSANITSKIAHGGSNENNAGVGISDLTSETTMKQQDASSKGFSENNQPLLRPTVALRDRIFSGMAGNASKDLTLSRRPPMRIDTGVLHAPESKSTPVKKSAISSVGHPYTPISSSTPNRQNPSASQTSSPPERMTTRVASGALRHKSVSEILGGTPRTATQIGDKSPHERASNDSHRDDHSIQTPRSASLIASPDTATFKLRLNELRDNQKSKLSTVVFARQQPSNSSRLLESSQPQSAEADDVRYENKDYLQSLFTMQASVPPVSHPLHTLILSAHKTLSTANHYVDFRELQDCRMLERIFQLQSNNRWSLRQLERSVEPERPTSHWDVLISQAKWMRTDFREERKWKIAAAKATADSCANWVRSSAEGRKALQIRAKVLPAAVDARPLLAPTPELVSSAEDDSSVITDVDTPHVELSHSTAPAAIFSLAREMFIFGVDKTPVTEKLLLELPLYQPSMEPQSAALRISHCAPDSSWKTSLIPISKFTQGKMVSHEQGPPRKRSRYNYYDLDRPKHEYANAMFPPLESFGGTLEPVQEDVALFNPENKHIRDRIHAGHAFRPPSEHIMPSQSFFESRQSSQWTQGEDDELRKLVREYAYNWSLISSCLSSSSIFSSGAERRTPWECFERWIGLEGLPAEMSKTQYFRAYHSRLQAAQRTHEAQQQALQQQQGSNAPHLPVRRRTTQPYLVDRRKNDKHLRLVDAMRKLAKKRETALHKQQHGMF